MTEENYSKDFQEIKETLENIKTNALRATIYGVAIATILSSHSCVQRTRYEDLQSRLQRIEQVQSNLVERVEGGAR